MSALAVAAIALATVPVVASSPVPATSTPTTAPQPSPGTGTSPTGLGWIPVSLGLPDARWLTDLTAWAGGFAALESDDDDDLFALWTSPDGAAWERASLPDGVEGGLIVALQGDLYLLEPRGRGDSQELRVRTWRTADGERWQRQGLFEWHMPRSVSDDRRIGLTHVVAAPDRLVMFGDVDPCCGVGGSIPLVSRYASTLVAAAPEQVPLHGLVIWTSRDGAQWTRQSNRDLRVPEWGGNAWVTDVAGVPDGVLLTRASADGEVFHSPDGSTWESMGPLPPGYSDLGSRLAIADGRVVVSFEAREPSGHILEAWLRSPDGTWMRSLREPSTAGDGLVATGSLVVAATTGYDAGADTWPRLFVSTDGGATWDPGLSWSGPRGGCTRDLATDGARLVLFGCDEGTPTLWHADVPPTGTPG